MKNHYKRNQKNGKTFWACENNGNGDMGQAPLVKEEITTEMSEYKKGYEKTFYKKMLN